MIEVKEPGFYLNTFTRLFAFGGEPFQLILMMSVPAVAGMLVFHYLNHGAAADFLHSLPVKHTTFFCTHLTAGLLLVMVPVVLTGLISLLLLVFSQLAAWLSPGDILRWTGTTMLMNQMDRRTTSVYGDEITFTRRQDFQMVEEWLKQKGYYEEATVTAADIHQVAVQQVMNREEFEFMERNWVVQQPDSRITVDPEHITQSLALYSPSWRYPDQFPVYMVGFYDELGQQLFMGRFEADSLPDFVRDK